VKDKVMKLLILYFCPSLASSFIDSNILLSNLFSVDYVLSLG